MFERSLACHHEGTVGLNGKFSFSESRSSCPLVRSQRGLRCRGVRGAGSPRSTWPNANDRTRNAASALLEESLGPAADELRTEASLEFFSDELRQRVTDLYGVAPAVEYVEIAQIVDNSGS